jgi:hypothetical protein
MKYSRKELLSFVPKFLLGVATLLERDNQCQQEHVKNRLNQGIVPKH